MTEVWVMVCSREKHHATQSAVTIINSRTGQLFTHPLCRSAHPLLGFLFSWWCCTCWRACAQPSVEHDLLLRSGTSLFSSRRLVTGGHPTAWQHANGTDSPSRAVHIAAERRWILPRSGLCNQPHRCRSCCPLPQLQCTLRLQRQSLPSKQHYQSSLVLHPCL